MKQVEDRSCKVFTRDKKCDRIETKICEDALIIVLSIFV